MKRLLCLLFLCTVCASTALGASVWVLRIEGEIGRGMVSYVRAGLAGAAAAGADRVVLVMATPGGYLDAASATRDLILDSTVPTVAYVDREAFSAGALLALACERIYFAPGGVMGAATPVYFDGVRMEEAPEKVVSAVRALFRSTAQARGRDPTVAEAMVDRDVQITDLVERGKLLTLTADEADAWGYSEGQAATLAALLELEGLAGAELHTFTRRWTDAFVETLTMPLVAGLLIAVGMIGLINELLTPGLGLPGILGIGSLGLFLWAHFFVGMAGWESLVFFLLGFVAILAEVLLLTGSDFGIAGLGGLLLIGLGFYTAMVGPFTRPDEAMWAVGAVSVALVVALVGTVMLLTRLPRSRLRLGGVILSAAIRGRAFDTTPERHTSKVWVGKPGVAVTDLRPSGIARIDRERVDVVCEEGYLPKGTSIVVVRDEGYRKVVRRADGAERALEVTG